MRMPLAMGPTCCLLAAFAAACPPPSAAQVVTGQLRSSADRRPLPGAFLVLGDSLGRAHARTMSDRDGYFTLRAPRSGRYRLEAELLGYRTASSPLFTLGSDALEYPFTIEVAPVRLPTIEVASRERGCERRPDGPEVAGLWAEIRKVLAATAWTERFGGMSYTNHVYRLAVAPERRLLLEEAGSTTTARTRSPFAVATPADLARRGFSRQDSAEIILLGPDATVLTSDEFLNGHCFRLAADRRLPGVVGLAFEPLRRQRGVTDIRGTLWVDRESAALRRLEYTYTNLPEPYAGYGAGGELEFQLLGNGAWVVRSWRIRSPFLVVGRDADNRPGIQRRGTIEDGGVVLRAAEGARVHYAIGGDGAVAGVVRNQPDGSPLSGARVLLTGTGLSAETAADGRYLIPGVPPGRYGISFSHPVTRDLAIPVALDSIEVAGAGTLRHDFLLPRLDAVQLRVCPSTIVSDAAPGLVYGIVTDSAGQPVNGAEVRADWVSAGLARTVRARVGERSDVNGRYYICRLPPDTPLAIQLRAGSVHRLLNTRIPPAGPAVSRLDVQLSR